MGLNDEQEKIRQAEAWLRDPETDGIHLMAAREHLFHIVVRSLDPEIRSTACSIITSLGLNR